jgi:membrane protein required for colicin V production
MNTLDLSVVAVVVLSGLFAFVRGFVREALSIMAWLGAFAVAYYGYDHVVGIAEHWIANPVIAHTAAAGTLFVVSLLLFSVLVGIVSTQVRESSLGSADRTLGLVFGLARGALVVCIAYLVAIRLIEPGIWPPQADRLPPWIAEARLRPYLERGAAPLQQIVTDQVLERGAAAAEEAGQSLESVGRTPGDSGSEANPPAAKPVTPPQGGYNNNDRKDMNRAIEQSTDQ